VPERKRFGPGVWDLMLVMVVAAVGPFLGGATEGLSRRAPVLGPLDPAPARPEAAAVWRAQRVVGDTPASIDPQAVRTNTPVPPQPPVFPFSGQPQSSSQVDLRWELARMAAWQRNKESER
jgi:hypothetical protein